MPDTPTIRARLRSMKNLFALSAVLVLALSSAGCGQQSAPTKWPTAGEAKDQLTTKYGYRFVPYNDTYRSANASLQLQISVPQDLTSTRQMRVGIYNTPFATYSQDIDNVFAVIAPDATAWAHDEEKKAATVGGFQENYDSEHGVITCLWNGSVPLLVFVFNG